MADEDEERCFSPDSSTHVLNKEKPKHKRKKKHKHKSKKKKRKHSEDKTSDHDDQQSYSTNNSSAASDDDTKRSEIEQKSDKKFAIDIKLLTDYIDDRKELNNELFKILARKEMKKLMPKSVKKLDLDELKSRCLDQLEIISKKRLLSIIEGQEMSSSSSESGNGAANDVSAMETAQKSHVLEVNQPAVTDMCVDESVDIMEELSVGPDQDEIDALVEEPLKNAASEDKISNQATIAKADSPVKTADSPVKTGDSPVKTEDSPDDHRGTDTESQLVELEYRARALKSLMHARQRLAS